MKELLILAVAPIVIFVLVVVGMILVSRNKHRTTLDLQGLGLRVRFEATRTGPAKVNNQLKGTT